MSQGKKTTLQCSLIDEFPFKELTCLEYVSLWRGLGPEGPSYPSATLNRPSVWLFLTPDGQHRRASELGHGVGGYAAVVARVAGVQVGDAQQTGKLIDPLDVHVLVDFVGSLVAQDGSAVLEPRDVERAVAFADRTDDAQSLADGQVLGEGERLH